MAKIFATGVAINDGNSPSPSIAFISNKNTGLFLKDENSVGITSNRQLTASFGQNNIEFFKQLKITSGAKDGALLTSDDSGKVSWQINRYQGLFLWNSLYKSLDAISGNNIKHVTFTKDMSKLPHISITKESNYIIDNFDIYIKNKTNRGFDLYTNTIMYKQLLMGSIGQYSICRLETDDIGIAYYDINRDRLLYIIVDAQFKVVSYPVMIEDISVANVCKMIIVNGRPAIFYLSSDDETGNSVWKYVWATNVSGTSWYTPDVLLTANKDLSFSINNLFLLIINDKPAVFFHNESNQVQMIKHNEVGVLGWGDPVTIGDLTSHNILDVKSCPGGNIMVIARSIDTKQIYYTYSTDAYATSWNSSIILNKFDKTSLFINPSSDSNTLCIINGIMCIISSELSTSDVYINISNGTSWLGYRFLTSSNTNSISPSVFINNSTTYLLYNIYSGIASKKNLIEFSNTFTLDNSFTKTEGFIDNFNFGTYQKTLPNIKDGNNIIILGSNSGISLLKFYGNDFAISWSATI